MKKEIIVIIVLILLTTNVSIAIGISKKNVSIDEKTNSFIIFEQTDQGEVNYVFYDDFQSDRIFTDVAGERINLAPNPSFEEGDTLPSNWTYYSDTSFILNWNSDYAFKGEKSVGVQNLTKHNEGENAWITKDFIPVDFDKNYYLYSCWYKFDKPPSYDKQYAMISVWEYDENFSLRSGQGIGEAYNPEWDFMWYYHTPIFPNIKYIKITLTQVCSNQYKADPTVEARFDEVFYGIFNNSSPETLKITGKTNGKPGVMYNYSITSTDPDGDAVYYRIEWYEDYQGAVWQGPYHSGEEVIFNYSWNESGEYIIRVEARDQYYAKSDIATLKVIIPRTRACRSFIDRFPILQRILNFLL